MAKLSKRMKDARDGIDKDKLYPLGDAIKLLKDRSKTKFDETVEVAIGLGVDPRHSDQIVRGVVQLPNGTGRAMRVAVFAKDAKAKKQATYEKLCRRSPSRTALV